MLRPTLVACGILVLLALPSAATAAPGSLDPAFGTGGASVGPDGALVAADRDSAGRLLTVGAADPYSPLRVTRRTADGALDPTFGSGGTVTLGGASGTPSISVAPDDSVFVAAAEGLSAPVTDVVHLSSSGVPDPTFVVDLGETYVRSLRATPSGLLVLTSDSLNREQTLRRLTSTGTLDPGFGTGGRLTIPFQDSWSPGVPVGPLVATQPDGTIVVAGTMMGELAVAAVTVSGQPQLGFGTEGIAQVTLPRSGWPIVTGLGVGPTGDVVVVALGAVTRLTAAGQLDDAFGSDGVRVLELGAGRETLLSGATIQADGSVLVAGSIAENPLPVPVPSPVPWAAGQRHYGSFPRAGTQADPERAVIARLTPAGTIDCSYGTYGYQRLVPAGVAEPLRTAGAATIFAPGRTLLAGSTQTSSDASPAELILAVQGGAGTPAPAAAPVVANTRSATWYETLEGWVDPRCGDVTAHFEYGPTTAYGARTNDRTIGVAEGPRTITAYVPPRDLAVGEYHYRLVAEGAAGTTASADRTFTVVEEPGPPEQPGPPEAPRTPTVPAPKPPAKPAVGTLRLRSSRATLRAGKTVRLAVQCRGGACKRTTVTLRTGRTTLGTGSVSLASGRYGHVTVRFTAAGRKAARRDRSLRTAVLLAVTGGKTVKAAVTITSPKPKPKRKTAKRG